MRGGLSGCCSNSSRLSLCNRGLQSAPGFVFCTPNQHISPSFKSGYSGEKYRPPRIFFVKNSFLRSGIALAVALLASGYAKGENVTWTKLASSPVANAFAEQPTKWGNGKKQLVVLKLMLDYASEQVSPKGTKFRSNITFILYDCGLRQSSLVATYFFREQKARGNPAEAAASTIEEASKHGWQSFSAGSLYDTGFTYACRSWT